MLDKKLIIVNHIGTTVIETINCELIPFLSVISGLHVTKDVFDEENGLISYFKKRGIDVKTFQGGLIHYKEIQQLYINKLR